jgi:lipopolysaccharide/colanic/teichoic acid biosynthesis glycosyltransferase
MSAHARTKTDPCAAHDHEGRFERRVDPEAADEVLTHAAHGITAPQPPPGETLAERYARLADKGFRPRTVDVVLRGLDLVIATVSLVLLLPLALVLALLVRLSSGTPVVYRGRRVGRAGGIFTMYKFRTLRPDAEARLGPYYGEELTLRTEEELTPVGRVLRASQLDELPQLVNVLRGEMSIVGPRPIRPTFFEELCEQIPQYWQRLVVRPGMTGFAQLRITREMSWAEKLAHDLEYLADRSVGLYIRVVAATAWRVASGLVRGISSVIRRPR